MAIYDYKKKKFSAEDAAIIETSNKILNDYNRQGYILTLRQLHYQLVSTNAIVNTQESYKKLGKIVSDARMCGLMDWDFIEDRHRSFSGVYISEGGAAEAMRTLPHLVSLDKWEGQNNHVEVWVEKDALQNVVSRAAGTMNVGWMACKGYLSVTIIHEAAMRFLEMEEKGRSTVVIYLGDHDPSGVDMTRDVFDRINEIIRWHGGQEIFVDRIALTLEQVRANNLPPNPAKLSDSRSRKYVEKYGDTSWELDALVPQQLNRLIVDAVGRYRDDDMFAERQADQKRERAILTGMADNFSLIENAILDDPRDSTGRYIEFGEKVREAVEAANDSDDEDEEE